MSNNEMESILELESLKCSKIPDSKNIFKHEEKEKAFLKRYGKNVDISVTYDFAGDDLIDLNQLTEYTLKFKSNNNKMYAITEYMKDGNTTEVILSFRKNGRNYKTKFSRFLDAEVSLADYMSEE